MYSLHQFLILTFHYIDKLCSNILSKPRRRSVAFEASKTKKMTKKNKKLKNCKFYKKKIARTYDIRNKN